MPLNYITVTEIPGSKATKEQLARLYQRYHFASQFCKDKDVLEAACGGGMGLGYLSQTARKVVGGDLDDNIFKYAQDYYKGRDNIEFRKFDAQNLPFDDKSFEVVILFEAIYYLPKPETFVREARRVLKENGVLLICSANKDWTDFNPSPFSKKYFSAPELFSLVHQEFSDVRLFGAFPVSKERIKDRIISALKRTAITFHFMPKTMKGKEKFKKIFFGKLVTLPEELKQGITEYLPLVEISNEHPNSQYKVLFLEASV